MLTTEQLRARAAALRTDAATLSELGDTESSQRLNESANAFDELAANREAQPVGVMNIGSETCSDYRVAWTKSGTQLGKGVHWLYTTPPAPAPANANAVAWEMRYWNSGHNCWHDWERITAEQHAEMSVQHAADNDYEFRVLYDAPPAPAVPDAVDYSDLDATSQDREVIEAIAECKGWNACRAAMLNGGKS